MSFETEFRPVEIEHDGMTHEVWVGGEGPPVILMHELDGLGDACIALAERLAVDFRVYAPRFFGCVREREGACGLIKGIAYLCVRREFVTFARGKTSPIVNWVRRLARHASEQDPDHPRVGVVGMCMTGGIVLATVAEAVVTAGVAAQPSLPLLYPFAPRAQRCDLGMSSSDVDDAAASGTPILTLRFGDDRICPIERIEAINKRIPSSQEPPEFLEPSSQHTTLTALYRKGITDDDKHRSNQAIEETIAFLHRHLSME